MRDRDPLESGPVALWEPWTPRVGDRVRLRPSAECEVCVKRLAQTGIGIGDLEGVTGTVVLPIRSEILPGFHAEAMAARETHTIRVELDEPIPVENPPKAVFRWKKAVAVWMPAIELEPLERPDAG